MNSEVTQLCPTLCDPVDCSLPGFSVHGILQARILEWVTISFSRGSSRPRDRTRSLALEADTLTSEPPGKPLCFEDTGKDPVLVCLPDIKGFPGSSDGKESAYNAGDRVRSLGREDPLEKEMATHSSTLAWIIPWTEKPGRL